MEPGGDLNVEISICNFICWSNKQSIKVMYLQEHTNACKKPNIYESNVETNDINAGHYFSNINNVRLIKLIKIEKSDLRDARTVV